MIVCSIGVNEEKLFFPICHGEKQRLVVCHETVLVMSLSFVVVELVDSWTSSIVDTDGRDFYRIFLAMVLLDG